MAPEHGHGPKEIAARLNAQTDSKRLRNAIFGGIDGSATTFASVVGVQVTGLPAGIAALTFFAMARSNRMSDVRQ